MQFVGGVHFIHCLSCELVHAWEKVPVAHCVWLHGLHAVCPGIFWYTFKEVVLPASHTVQAVSPELTPIVPARHSEHVVDWAAPE